MRGRAARVAAQIPGLTAFARAGNRVIAFLTADRQARQPARRLNLDLDLMPLAVVDEIDWPVAYRILVAQLKRDLLENLVHLRRAVREKSLAAGDRGKLIQNGLAFEPERAVGIAPAEDAYRVEHNVGFLEQATH